MNTYQNLLNLFGRLLIVTLFLPAGLLKLSNFDRFVGSFTSLGLTTPTLAVVIAILVEVLGSIALIVGYKTRLVATVMAIFTVVASVFGHAYWAVPADQMMAAQRLFFKNIAVIGGLLILASVGARGISLDALKARK